MVEKIFQIADDVDLVRFYGSNDKNIISIQNRFDVKIIARGNLIKILGVNEDVGATVHFLQEWQYLVLENNKYSEDDFQTALHMAGLNNGKNEQKNQINDGNNGIIKTYEGTVKPKNRGQIKLYEAIATNDVVFTVGPAGTGKTYIAVALAVSSLLSGEVKKIILSRPAVEAGESLGFLPGDFKEKIDPYLKPLYDALEDMLKPELIKKFLDLEVIEIIPMAYMRGRTLNNAFVILDEAQNTTFMQMKMFLTRLGFNSKAVITGDITQVDLPKKSESGLINGINILTNIKGIEFVKMDKEDVVRHRLVKEIIEAYDRFDDINSSRKSPKKH